MYHLAEGADCRIQVMSVTALDSSPFSFTAARTIQFKIPLATVAYP